LAIAKMAMQIQFEEKPRFKRIFVALGAFHVEMAFFGAIGKVVAESGGPHVLNECDVLAKGSLNSFYKGTHYNRCKRLHELLALAMELLHFQRFASALKYEDVAILSKAFQEGKDLMVEESCCTEVNEILKSYDEFTTKTRKGDHGKTAEFWLKYVDMIHLYHTFTRSQRTGDFNLFVSCLPELTDYFFALNHHNYARWAVRYYHNLELQLSYPNLILKFMKILKMAYSQYDQTTKPFSGSPITN